MKRNLFRTLLLAAAVGAAGLAQAYTNDATFNVPQQAGEASTMTNGVPNAHTNVNDVHTLSWNDYGWVEQGASPTASFDVPLRAGEASTMTNGVPNALTTNDRVVASGANWWD